MLSEKKLDELAQNNIMEFYDLDSREFFAFRTDEIRLYKLGYRQAEADAAELVEGLRRVILWAECASAKMESRENINWTYLNDGRAALAKWRERGV